MISFKQYLAEARMAPLYHATNAVYIWDILSSDSLVRGSPMPGLHPSKSGKIVSTTRSLDFAKSWGSIIFQLDQQKLAQRYKIVPFSYFGAEDKYYNIGDWKGSRKPQHYKVVFENQYEEAILQDVKDLHRYVTKIHIGTNNIRNSTAVSKVEQYADKYKIPVEMY